MRKLVPLLLAAAWFVPSLTQAQEKKVLPPEVKKITVGFRTFQDDERSVFKVGLWTPIYVEVFGGTDGVAVKPTDREAPYIKIAASDNEDVGTEIRVPVTVEPTKTRTFLGYVKAAHMGGASREFRATLYINGRPLPTMQIEPSFSLQIDQHLYLTIGSRMNDLHHSVKNIGKARGKEVKDDDWRGDPFRNVVFETEVDRLPERWFGYNSVDLLVLGTEKRKFLTDLNLSPDRVAAIATWVRRGGRLVVPIAPQNQDAVAALLNNAAWQPAVPVVPPAAPAPFALDNLAGLASWGGVATIPFEYRVLDAKTGRLAPQDIRVAVLEPANVPAGAPLGTRRLQRGPPRRPPPLRPCPLWPW
jgi:hypothetical protein